MEHNWKIIGQYLVSNCFQTGDGLYASDGSKAVIMIGCVVSNILTTSVDVTVTVKNSSNETNLVKNVTVPAGDAAGDACAHSGRDEIAPASDDFTIASATASVATAAAATAPTDARPAARRARRHRRRRRQCRRRGGAQEQASHHVMLRFRFRLVFFLRLIFFCT